MVVVLDLVVVVGLVVAVDAGALTVVAAVPRAVTAPEESLVAATVKVGLADLVEVANTPTSGIELDALV